jgi:hypothetical protein
MQQAIAIVIGAALIAGALVYQGWSQHQDRQQGGQSGQRRFQEFQADKLIFMRLDTWTGLTSICVVRGKSQGEASEGVVRCYPWSE